MEGTLQHYMMKSLERYEENPAITDVITKETITYKEMRTKIDAIASYLHHLGVRQEMRVVYSVPNSIDYVLMSLALMKIGVTSSPMGVKLGEREIDFILNDVEPHVLIVGTDIFLQRAEKYAREQHPDILVALEGFDLDIPDHFHAFNRRKLGDVVLVESFQDAEPEEISTLAYTGGTTGTPKGVVHTQKGMLAALIACSIEYPLDDQDIVLLSTPLQHSAGSIMLRTLTSGAHLLIDTFTPERFLNVVTEKKVTMTFVVPTMIYRVIDAAKQRAYDVRSIKSIFYGSSPISSARLKEAIEMFGPVFVQQYGATEANVLICRMHKSDHLRALQTNGKFIQSCGKPCLMTELKIVNEDGDEVARGEKGEIILQAPYLMQGYYKRDDLTAEVLKDGWFYTGDIGQQDEEGFVYIVDRKKDMIISGGMNVYSVEVEKVVNQHPSVKMSACIGVPDDDWGEAVLVFVKLEEGQEASEDDIIAFCKERTSKYMVPKKILFQDQFPLTQIGKIDKKQLKSNFWQDQSRMIH